MDTIFVTGAEGFTGSHLLAHLRQRGHTVVAGVRNRARKLAYERHGIKAIVCDVTDAINVARVVASVRPGGVVHLAGPADAADVAGEPLNGYQNTISAWANVLDAVRRAVPRGRVVLASGWQVYGTAGQDGQPLAENIAPQPTTMLGSLKLAAETMAHAFFRHYHLNVTIARPFSCTGPGQPSHSYWGTVGRQLAAVDAAAESTTIALPNLSCACNLLHVKDLVTAYERLLQDGRPNEVYNICAERTWTCREIVEGAASGLGLKIALTDTPAGGTEPALPLSGDSTRLRSELGWQPAGTPVEALTELVTSLRTLARVAAQTART